MAETKAFPTGDVLSATTGYLVTPGVTAADVKEVARLMRIALK